MSKNSRRAAFVAGITALTLAGVSAPALAHVTVQPGSAEKGSWSKVTFRVPNERDDAATTKLVVELPADYPIAFVSVKPLPGWTVAAPKAALAKPVDTGSGEITEAVAKITWEGGKIEAGQFQEFDVTLGPLPTTTDRLVFKADQTYSSGEVVKWADVAGAGAGEPEHPAPVLELTAPAEGTDAHGMTVSAAEPATGSDGQDGTARLLGGLGLAAGLVGLVLGGLGFARGRRAA
ncbi:YcnI family protein [Actinocorallia sp. A-T 12471]|uniref:YcnI family copper-binding membrane protein n=1 Tax=Actinocorallia sp. A-T 12471 TaxID=3089813 RepID=UPI0029CFA579|nr:YcnI family protein [Actinocorallia sp. A-T 12471]MDX6741858.1 YcnI family protein [Actinocorallia sp. A-T 12471]